ncbi:MAG: site-specific integrase [Planctomycetota bacterium]
MEQSVQAMFELYLSRNRLRPASVDMKRRACRFFLEWFGQPVRSPDGEVGFDLPLRCVTSALADDYREKLGQDRSAVSVNGYLNNFRPFWAWLRKRGDITVDPFGFIGPVKVDEEPPRETFTARELARLMAVASAVEQLQLCFGLLSCRRGEMQAIQVCDVRLGDPDGAHVLLKHKKGGDKTLPWGAKGHKARLIGLPAAMAFDGRIVALQELVAARIKELHGEPEGYLCVEERFIRKRLAGPRHWGALRDLQGNHPRSFRALQRRAGIREPRRFHELRSAFITMMLDAGIDSIRVAQLAGHASVQQTRQYDRHKWLSLVTEAAQVAAGGYVSKAS